MSRFLYFYPGVDAVQVIPENKQAVEQFIAKFDGVSIEFRPGEPDATLIIRSVKTEDGFEQFEEGHIPFGYYLSRDIAQEWSAGFSVTPQQSFEACHIAVNGQSLTLSQDWADESHKVILATDMPDPASEQAEQ